MIYLHPRSPTLLLPADRSLQPAVYIVASTNSINPSYSLHGTFTLPPPPPAAAAAAASAAAAAAAAAPHRCCSINDPCRQESIATTTFIKPKSVLIPTFGTVLLISLRQKKSEPK
jgi:hypothetical protein